MKRLTISALAVWALALAGPVWAQTQDEPPPSSDPYQNETQTDPLTTEPSESLPDTAGPMPLMAAAGVLAIGLGLRRLRARD